MFNAMIETLKSNPRKIVFTEGPDPRILEATDRLKKGGFLTPILIGNVDEVKAQLPLLGNLTWKASRSSIPPRILRWMPWWRKWLRFARAR